MKFKGRVWFARCYRSLSASHKHFEKIVKFNSAFAWQNQKITKKDLFKAGVFVESCQRRAKNIVGF